MNYLDITFVKVYIDPKLKRKIVDTETFEEIYEHMDWCYHNCKSHWFNTCNDYSYIWVSDTKEALKFALIYGGLSEEEKVFYTLKWG